MRLTSPSSSATRARSATSSSSFPMLPIPIRPTDRVRLSAAAVLLALAVTACSSPSTTPPPGPPYADLAAPAHPFYSTLDGTALADAYPPEQLWRMGVATCERLDAGATPGEAIEALSAETALVDPDERGVLVGAAVLHVCTQHQAAAEAWVEGQG